MTVLAVRVGERERATEITGRIIIAKVGKFGRGLIEFESKR